MTAHQLGADDDPDLFAVGFSSSDVVGHTYGMDSQEQMDEYLRLDLTLGRLFDEIDRRVGLDRVIIGFSADHGAMPLVENLVASGVPARRVPTAEVRDPVTRALESRFGARNGLVARLLAAGLLPRPRNHRAARAAARRDVEVVVEKALLETGLVEKVYTTERLLGDPPTGDPYFALMRRSFFEPRSPQVMVVLKDGLYLSDRPGGTGHGTPHEYDRHVPVVFMGASARSPAPTPPRAGPRTSRPRWPRCFAWTIRCRTRTACSPR